MKSSGIGGQAVMEGIMMRNGSEYSVAVRKENGEIEVKKETYKGVGSKCKLFRLPFISEIFKLFCKPFYGGRRGRRTGTL